MLNPFIDLVSTVISIYSVFVFAWVIMSLLMQFEVINRNNLLAKHIFTGLSQVVEPALAPFRRLQRKLFPRMYAVDLSPIFLILALQFIRNALYYWVFTP